MRHREIYGDLVPTYCVKKRDRRWHFNIQVTAHQDGNSNSSSAVGRIGGVKIN